MNRLQKIATSATPGSGVQFVGQAYGSDHIHRFLRDVIALANAPVEGPRYIVTGVEFDAAGARHVHGVADDDFSGRPAYASLVAEFVEPPLRVSYQPVNADGTKVGVYEIDDCRDTPYMMRTDQSEQLRRGDAYVRVDNHAIKMGRRQFQDMFERKFRDAVSSEQLEVGFAGDIIHKMVRLDTVDLAELPSAVASNKLEQMIDVREQSTDSGATTVMARLMHARLYGADSPYEDRSPTQMMRELDEIQGRYVDEDQHFMFETHAQKVQLVALNQGSEPIADAALSLVMPAHHSLYVASELPLMERDGHFVARSPVELGDYPSVAIKDNTVHVSAKVGTIGTRSPVPLFETPLRICVGDELKGRRLGIRYAIFGSNLKRPAEGKLRIQF